MKAIGLFVVILIASSVSAHGKTLNEYIIEAEGHKESDNIERATIVMEEAVENYPDSSDAYAYLGLYKGMLAGETQNFMEAGRLVNESFSILDHAVSLDSLNPLALFFRGLMGVNVPEFLGRLDMGINDLGSLIEMHESSCVSVSSDIIVQAYDHLGLGYKKRGDLQDAESAWQKVIELASGTELAEIAEENIKRISSAREAKPSVEGKTEEATTEHLERNTGEIQDPAELIQTAKTHIKDAKYEEAEVLLRRAIDIDSSGVEAYKLLSLAINGINSRGYDKNIYDNTELRMNLSFEAARILDKAVELAPDDIELRLIRGATKVSLPFFVGTLDEGIEDLNLVINSASPDSIRVEALYCLGYAHQRKAMTYWIEVVSEYSDTRTAQSVFDGMRPSVEHIDITKYETPFVVIDFVLGFQDKLEPQTAVWIEDEHGNFIKTIYISGFSGYAKETQINLPRWSETSQFVDVDAVTEASIDIGHHIYVWDLRDFSGREIKPGKYTVKIEASWWPSMKYQMVSANINIGESEKRTVIEEGNLIPYLEVEYYPR